MRLDSYLVKSGSTPSRSRAKHAIIQGHIRINNKVITRPSFDVEYSDNIEIARDMDKPAGYWKLKQIQEQTYLIKKGDTVLDIGSSAGGFLLFASEFAAFVHGIEFSHEFCCELEKIANERPNVTIEFNDVFTMLPGNEEYDVLLLDITVNPSDSIKALVNVLPALKKDGMLLHVFKIPIKKEKDAILEKLSLSGVEIMQILEAQKKEMYVIAKKL